MRCCDLVAASVSVESNVQLDYDDDDDDDNDDVMRITPAMNESELISNNQRRVAIEARDRLHDKLNVGGIRGSAHRWRHQRYVTCTSGYYILRVFNSLSQYLIF